MAIVKPFRALRPLPEQAAAVASVPYDVVTTKEAAVLAGDNPLSFLRVSRSEIEMPTGTDIYSDEVYGRAASNFDRLISSAPLIIEDEPSFYLYRLRMGAREQTGLVACCSIDEYDNDIIRKHERTRRDKEDDRTRHMLALRAQTGPILLTYRPSPTVVDDTQSYIDAMVEAANGRAIPERKPEFNELMRTITPAPPLFDFIAADDITHTIWRVPAQMNEALIEAFNQVPSFYIADGHHRAKSASRARASLRATNQQHNGDEEYNFFQCVLFPADQLQILPYNRAVKDLNLNTAKEFLSEVGREFEISEHDDPRPKKRGDISMYLDGRWYGLEVKSDVTRRLRIIERLDVSVLQDLLLTPILGIQDPRTDKRIDFIGGIRGTRELEMLVDEGKAAVAFSLHPVTVDELMAISDAGEIMPPKSTWFEPKLRDGLLSHLI
ncbi:MAG: DUF1015 family protein [Acidobacteria bacterium]|nr:DUF1015 family protein [Acidobacteriota bacterium]